MKTSQNHAYVATLTFKSIPIVRLDSGAVRIPVEFTENLTVTQKEGRVLRICVRNGAFAAWR